MKFRLVRCFIAFGFLSVLCCRLRAIAPGYISDEELARYPVIVVAKWEKAPFKEHHRVETREGEKHNTAFEVFTDLKVERVIAGNLNPGVHRLMVGLGISWDEEGNRVSTGTSTELMGDASHITGPNIWFLQKERSWDGKDKTEYLSISNYRAIQPLFLEDYFKAQASAHPETEVPKLLSSSVTEVVKRSLRYVAGGLWPGPHDQDFEAQYQKIKKGTVLHDHAAAVAAVIARKELKEVRELAVAVYAELEGAKCMPYVRGLLSDQDPDVRATAVAVLVYHKDSDSLPAIIGAVNGKENGSVACKIIEAMSGWGELRLVPALAAFLETDEMAYQIGDDVGIPALKAREVLFQMTGHWFPYDVKASLLAWKEAGQINDFEKRKQLLVTILPNDPNPLKAEMVGDGSTNAACKITNKSNKDVVITRLPAGRDQRWSSGMAGGGTGMGEPKGKRDFITLKPGESTKCPFVLEESLLHDVPIEGEPHPNAAVHVITILRRAGIRHNSESSSGVASITVQSDRSREAVDLLRKDAAQTGYWMFIPKEFQ